MPECIHDLEIPLCDICYPKAKPVVARSARVSTPRAPRVAGVSTSRKSINVDQQRVYHVTHVRNLEAILASGGLRADAVPVVDLSTELTRELRGSAEVVPGRSVAEYVPFYLVPSATQWDDLRAGAVDETRWSAAARASASSDFIALVTTVGALGEGTVVTDGDAAGSFTRFAPGEAARSMLERLHDTDYAGMAEVLASDEVPFSAVQLIGVANDRVRDQVRQLTTTKVAVYPPWFLPV